MPPPTPLPDDVNSADLLGTLFAISLTGIILFRPLYAADGHTIVDLTYEHLNPAAQQMLGLPLRPTESFLTLYPTSKTTGVFDFYCSAFLSGRPERYEKLYQADRLDGYFLLVAQRQGPLLAVSFTDTNDHSRSAVEEALRESQARERQALRETQQQQLLLSRILRQTPAAIATLGTPGHHYTFFNDLYQQLSANRTHLGQSVAEVFPEFAEQGFITLLDQSYRTGKPFMGTEVPAQLYDAQLGRSRQYYIDFIYQPLFDEHEQVFGILAFILDVTDKVLSYQQVALLHEELAAANEKLRLTNEELHSSNTQLTRTNVDLDTFIYTASHDLRAPIHNIEGLLAALRDQLPAGVQAEEITSKILGMMQGATERFLTTIDQLTDISRLQQAQDQPLEPVLLLPVVENVCLDIHELLQQSRAVLTVAVAPDVRVQFSPKNLRSVVYNLLSNAIKYRHPDRLPVLELRAVATGSHVMLTMQDNGLGLAPWQLQRLFGLFQRLHTHVEGTGVGLHIVKRMVENAGGLIAVQSEEGQGTTFSITLRTGPTV